MSALRIAVLSVALLVAGGEVIAIATDGFRAFTTETARRLAVRRRPVGLPAVPLENQSGVAFTVDDLRGRWVLVDFIYTRCLTMCAVLGGDFSQLERQLAEPIARGRLQLLSVSFDPAHDAPADLASYLTRFRGHGPGWEAARPVAEEGLKQITTAFGITVIPDQLGGYTHNAAIHLVDPAGRLLDIYAVGQVELVTRSVLDRLTP